MKKNGDIGARLRAVEDMPMHQAVAEYHRDALGGLSDLAALDAIQYLLNSREEWDTEVVEIIATICNLNGRTING